MLPVNTRNEEGGVEMVWAHCLHVAWIGEEKLCESVRESMGCKPSTVQSAATGQWQCQPSITWWTEFQRKMGGGGGGGTQERTAWKQMRTPVPWFAGHLSILVPVGKWGTTDKLGTLEPVVDWLHWVMPHQNEFEPKQISSHWAMLRHKAQGSEASSQSLDTNLACSLLLACWTSSSGHTHLLIPTQPATKGLQPKHPCTQTK